MLNFDPKTHYWQRLDGTVWSSAAQKDVSADDSDYLAWLEAGNFPTPYPRDEAGEECEAVLAEVLAPYRLHVSAATERIEEIKAELIALDRAAIRPTRAVLVAQAAGAEPAPYDAAKLAEIEASADELRAELVELGA